jgi:dCTP deaminase
MSVLVDWQIGKMIDDGEIIISPLDKSLINPNSVDIRLGGNFSSLVQTSEMPIDLTDKSTFTFEPFADQDEFVMLPGEFLLASLLEDITLPDNICAEIRGKSSIGRCGIANSSVAGIVDTGWSGVLTIELYNYTKFPVVLKKGQKIGQIIFHRTEKCKKPYSKTGRYYRQDPGTGSKGIDT